MGIKKDYILVNFIIQNNLAYKIYTKLSLDKIYVFDKSNSFANCKIKFVDNIMYLKNEDFCAILSKTAQLVLTIEKYKNLLRKIDPKIVNKYNLDYKFPKWEEDIVGIYLTFPYISYRHDSYYY